MTDAVTPFLIDMGRAVLDEFDNIVYWNEPDRGGHFAAWEQPGLFVDEVRAVARAIVAR